MPRKTGPQSTGTAGAARLGRDTAVKAGGKEALRHLKFEHLHLILLKVGIF